MFFIKICSFEMSSLVFFRIGRLFFVDSSYTLIERLFFMFCRIKRGVLFILGIRSDVVFERFVVK